MAINLTTSEFIICKVFNWFAFFEHYEVCDKSIDYLLESDWYRSQCLLKGYILVFNYVYKTQLSRFQSVCLYHWTAFENRQYDAPLNRDSTSTASRWRSSLKHPIKQKKMKTTLHEKILQHNILITRSLTIIYVSF